MDSKPTEPATDVSQTTDHVEKTIEAAEMAMETAKEDAAAAAAPDLTAKEQYQRLWANLKKDRRYVFWSLYIMSLVFA